MYSRGRRYLVTDSVTTASFGCSSCWVTRFWRGCFGNLEGSAYFGDFNSLKPWETRRLRSDGLASYISRWYLRQENKNLPCFNQAFLSFHHSTFIGMIGSYQGFSRATRCPLKTTLTEERNTKGCNYISGFQPGFHSLIAVSQSYLVAYMMQHF